MPDPIDPPRPSLRSAVRSFLAGCHWNQTTQRVEDANGNPIRAWLNQTGTPALTAAVQWDAGTTTQAGSAVQATIPQTELDIVKNGAFDAKTGLVTHLGQSYRFSLEIVSGIVTMKAWPV